MHTTKITVEEHIAEYCVGKWGTDFAEPVRFPDNLDIYHTLSDLTQKMPSDVFVISGNLEVVLPTRTKDGDSIRKNPEVYNYISGTSSQILNRKIKILFWAELHEEVDSNRHRHGISIIESIYTFMCRYRITKITEDALVKHYQRWRYSVRRREKRAYKKQ